jgi:hypothetical protein
MLINRLCVAVASVAFFVLPTLAQKDSVPSDSELAAITARGRLLYEYDQAAWHGSDAAMALHPPKEDVGRYIARKTDAGWEVAFGHLNESRDAFLIAVVATQAKSLQEFTAKKLDAPRGDTGFYLAAAKGIEMCLKDFQGVKQPYNIAVLPAESSQLYVYLVPAQTEDGVYPLGADERYLVSADGGTIVDKRRLHKGMISNRGPIPPGATQAGGTHSHVLSDLPEDTDVLYVLTRKPSMPEFIGTEIAIYSVNPDGTIKVTERMKKKH